MKYIKVWFKGLIFFVVLISIYNAANFFYRDMTNVFEKLKDRDTTIYIIIHHTASSGDRQLIDFYNFHKNERKFTSIAYSFIISPNGVVNQLHQLNESTNHCSNYNQKSIGVCLEGNFDESNPTFLQKLNLIILVNYLKYKYNVSKTNIIPHSKFRDTDCPGKNFDFDNFLKYIIL